MALQSPTLLEQVEELDYETRERLLRALTKAPKKSSEDILLEDMNELLQDSESRIIRKLENLFVYLLVFLVFCIYAFTIPPKTNTRVLLPT